MKERGMIFNAEMVRAILDGRKTQTRRIMKPQPEPCPRGGHWWSSNVFKTMLHVEEEMQNGKGGWAGLVGDACPFGDVGERIWVRETFGFELRTVGGAPHEQLVYRASKPDAVRLYDCNGKPYPMKWTPSLHMRRKYSRITLEITGVRVERLNDISDGDAINEGCRTADMKSGDRMANVFERLWSSIYGSDSWSANPWMWVIEFKVVPNAQDNPA